MKQRKIIFRAKRLKNEEKRKWFYYEIPGTMNFGLFKEDFGVWYQCLGEKDDRGVDIYEGDIIKVETMFNEVLHQVKFGDFYNSNHSDDSIAGNGFYIEPIGKNSDKRNVYGWNWLRKPVIVVGNIEDDPELLEK